jgi:hypothetical protein
VGIESANASTPKHVMDWINFIEAPYVFGGANSSTRAVGVSADSGL